MQLLMYSLAIEVVIPIMLLVIREHVNQYILEVLVAVQIISVVNYVCSRVRNLIHFFMWYIMVSLQMKECRLFQHVPLLLEGINLSCSILILVCLIFNLLWDYLFNRWIWSWIVKVILVMSNHWVYEIVWVTYHIAFDLSIVHISVLVIDFIHSLVVMLLCTSTFFYDNCLFF